MPINKQLPHILLQDTPKPEKYTYPGEGGPARKLPPRDRAAHAEHLLEKLDLARSDAREREEEIRAWGVPAKKGVHLEFESEPGFDLELGSLDSRSPKGIQLVTVREAQQSEGPAMLATVFIPTGKLASLEKKIRKYETEDTKKGRPWHQKLVEKISQIRLAQLRSFWTDQSDLFPATAEAIWWEVWLRSAEEEILESFRETAERLEIRIGERSLSFPSTRVVLAHGTLEQLSASVEVVDAIAELRRAKEVPSFFMEMPGEIGEWIDDLRRRTQPPPPTAPSVCLLDTGVNAGHPLLQIAVDSSDLHAVDPAWRVDDHDGHGTGMAGLALYGDLTEALMGAYGVELSACLESVKILPPPPQLNDPELYGQITRQAVGRVEVERPARRRTHVMPVSTTDGRERGRPSSWSAAVDQLAYGDDGAPQRFFVLAAGNNENKEAWPTYPAYLETDEIHDPGQAWNALTVGAFTERWRIEEEDRGGWEPLARPGELGPNTSTSLIWESSWPLKPDVVLEGGNAARSPDGEIDQPDSLSLLTTYYRPTARLLTTFGDTSGASALAARMATALQGRYSAFWPETIRALIVHSAAWTEAMLERYGPLETKKKCERLIRRCGFGVPSLERALWSANNRLTLVAQESFQPYIRKRNEKTGTKSTTLNELQIYELPWPIQDLRDLGEQEVELRVTLSYFIEPNPSERGYRYRHRYSSHGFRFDVRGATEHLEEFKKRLNKASRDKGEPSPGTSDSSGWLLGSALRHRGSLHSDIWRGTAADLANRQHMAVYPVSGWWKERHNLERWRRKARYSLVVSIHAPEVEVDLYTPVRNAIDIPVEWGSE